MSVARAEIVDRLPAGRNVALVRQDGDYLFLFRKGQIQAESCEELAELVQRIINEGDAGDTSDWPPRRPGD